MKTVKRAMSALCVMTLVCLLLCGTAFASSGSVSTVVENTWKDVAGQVKTVVNNVVFPCLNLILGVFFVVKLAGAYFDYRKHGQFEWTAPAILFFCLVFALTAPTYIWTIVGI